MWCSTVLLGLGIVILCGLQAGQSIYHLKVYFCESICTSEGTVAGRYSLSHFCYAFILGHVQSQVYVGRITVPVVTVCLCVYVSLHVGTLHCVTPDVCS